MYAMTVCNDLLRNANQERVSAALTIASLLLLSCKFCFLYHALNPLRLNVFWSQLNFCPAIGLIKALIDLIEHTFLQRLMGGIALCTNA